MLRRVRDDSARTAAGLGAAVMAASVLSLVVSVVMANLVGPADYADFAALLSVFLVLSIPGTAMQASVARDVAAAGREAEAIASHVRHLARIAALAGAAVVAVAFALRSPLSDVTGTPTEPVATALTIAVAAGWLVVSIQRGALQGVGQLTPVGLTMVAEALGRLVLGIVLVEVGWGVGGAIGGYVATLAALGVVLDVRLPRRPPAAEPVRALLRGATVPGASALLLAVAQNIDIIVVQHVAPSTPAGQYAAASLTGKSVVWLAVGLGLLLLPEASRGAATGDDARPLLLRCLAATGVGAALMLIVLAIDGPALIRLVFGDDYVVSRGLLLALGGAGTALAATTLLTQYLLGVRRVGFLVPLGAGATAVVPSMVLAGPELVSMALAFLAIQVVMAALVGALAAVGSTMRRR